jgi:Stress up-regulated Nod 19
MKRISMLVTVVLLMAAALAVAAIPAHAATKTVRYGPFTIPAASGDMPSMLEKVKLGVAKPCTDCYITSFSPDLTYPDGTTANFNTGAMLHHAVFTSQFRSDATCGSSGTLWGVAGERFFGSGNERTAISFPYGYGYRVKSWDSWNLLVELMNMETYSQSVYVDVTYTYRSARAPVKPLKPVWLDIDNCGDSEYSIPAGYSDTHWDWQANVEGKIVAMGGHLHDYGVKIEATNESTKESICTSAAAYGNTAEYMGHISSMSVCKGDPERDDAVAYVDSGDVVRIHSIYDSPEPRDDVMGIMLAYIYRMNVP